MDGRLRGGLECRGGICLFESRATRAVDATVPIVDVTGSRSGTEDAGRDEDV